MVIFNKILEIYKKKSIEKLCSVNEIFCHVFFDSTLLFTHINVLEI